MTALPRRTSSSTSLNQHHSASRLSSHTLKSSPNDSTSTLMSPSATATATASSLQQFEPKTRLTTGTLDWRAESSEQRIEFDRDSSTCASDAENDDGEGGPKVSPQGRQDEQSISPFLTKHIPAQYAPLSHLDRSASRGDKNSNTKYCYRHHPDLKCRRQANEPSMDQLQRELASLPQSDQEAISRVWSLFSAAPSKHRNMMLQGILAQCCFPQLSYISASVRDLIKIDFLSALPDEIGLRILCFLDPNSICKAAQVSERWRKLADDDQVWLKMCEQHIDRKCTKCGWGLPLLDRKRLRNEKRQMQLRQLGQYVHDHRLVHQSLAADDDDSIGDVSRPNLKRFASESLVATSTKRSRTPQSADDSASLISTRQPWKDVYRDRFRIGNNWKHGRCSTKVFRGHTNGVLCLQFDDNIIASGSYDSTIKIWDIEKGTEIQTLRGHTMGVRCLQFDDHVLASGSLDGSIRLWNRHTGQLLCHIPKADESSATQGHSGPVVGLHLEDSTIVSGSADKTVRVFDFKKKHCIVLRGHSDWVNAVHLDSPSRTVISASDDCTVKLWDLDTKSCMKTLIGHVGQVQAVVVLPQEFEPHESDADAADAALSEDGSPSFTYENADSKRPLPPRYILTGSLDNNIRLWDVHTGRCLQTFFGHLEGIWGLAADTLRVVSGGNDCMVKIWDPRTGTCERTFYHHSGPVTCVGLSDRRLCTGSEDHEIRLYSFCADLKSSALTPAS